MTKAIRLLIHAALCCALVAAAAHAQTRQTARTQTVERVVHVAPPAAGASRYVYVPFDVPRGAVRVGVAYDYAREGGANTIDLGVFDSRFGGADTDARGFRGWSGGRRGEFFITRAEATPGYLPGPLTAGTWRIILGLYKVAPAGVDVKFRIFVETERAKTDGRAAERPAAREAERLLPRVESGQRHRAAGPDLYWFAGDLHTHTVHSDGDWTVSQLAEAAYYSYLDFVFVTDHNTSSHHADVARVGVRPRKLLVLRGEEITTYGGHANAWGLPTGAWVDFRVRPGDNAAMSRVAARAHELGALVSANHPAASCGGCDWSYWEALKDFDAVEVWNGEWDATDEAALKLWDGRLRRGLRTTAVASSDTHRPQNPVGRPTTHVAARALTEAALLDGIRRGRVYLTAEAARPSVSFEAERRDGARTPRALPGDEISFSGQGMVGFYVTVRDAPADATVSFIEDGRALRTFPVGPDGGPLVVEMLCDGDAYYRVEVRDAAGKMLALTNPIYVKFPSRR
ncbi:MAG TPA: CehA/McbA family metallohydrolase [Pyrinomonadaceae bacterium]|nr:CehA/McbA family metallohydrolase [Pyrinomonadaceae bacterium]